MDRPAPVANRPDGPSARVVGVEYEEGAYWRKGSKDGPAAILGVLQRIRPQSLRTNEALHMPLERYLAPSLSAGPYDRSGAFAAIQRAVDDLLFQGCAPIVLGGDHSITYPVVRSLAARHGPCSFSVLHLDAHSDTFPATDGYDYHHGAVFRKIVEDGLVAASDVHQVGLRGFVPEGSMQFATEHGYQLVTATELRNSGCELDALGIDTGRPCYVSLDIDVVDPAFAPGTGTPVPGGLTSSELLHIVHQITRLPLVGLDLVEVAPIYDPAAITALLAAHVVMEILIADPFIAPREAGRAWA